jgi:large subunit ribosomal protein L21
VIAVFLDRNKQYRAREGQEILIDSNSELEPGVEVTFDKVLYVDGEGSGTSAVGTPYVEGGSVSATVEGHERGKKIVVGKFRRRKKYRRKTGHRQDLTRIKIKSIQL